MPRRAYIFGNGGHARAIAALLAADVATTFVVAGPQSMPLAAGTLTEADFLARADEHRQADVYLGIGSNAVRRALLERLTAAGLRLPALVAPTAFVARDAVIGDGSVVCAGAVVGAASRIGAGVIVNTLSGVDHDCHVGDGAQITVGVSLAGGVSVGVGCFLGMKCAVFPGVAVGDGSIVMAGALVTKDVAAGVQVGGVPARVVKRLAPA